MNSLYNIIKRFVVTNKSTDGEIRGIYTCMVDSSATKIDIKSAFKTLYGVEVSAVNVHYTRPKLHNTKKGIVEKRGIEKKAVVTLKNGQKIVNFEKIK